MPRTAPAANPSPLTPKETPMIQTIPTTTPEATEVLLRLADAAARLDRARIEIRDAVAADDFDAIPAPAACGVQANQDASDWLDVLAQVHEISNDVALAWVAGYNAAKVEAPEEEAPAPEEAPIRTISVPMAKGGYNFSGVSSHRGPCVCCGRDVKSEKYTVAMGDGGSSLIHPDDAERAAIEDLDFMGAQPVGPECRKLIPAEYLIVD